MNKTFKKNDIIFLAFLILNITGFFVLSFMGREADVVYMALSLCALSLVWFVLRKIPTVYFVPTMIFVFMAMFLGSCAHFYRIFAYYDILLHFSSGIIIAYLAGYFWKKTMGDDKGFMMNGFSFLSSVAGAGLWEIWEFCADTFFGFNSQLGSLTDTMTDIIAGTLGGALFCILSFVLAKFAQGSREKKKESFDGR